MSVEATMAMRRSISRTLSRYCSKAARSAAPSWLWNVLDRSRIRSSRLSDSRAFNTRSLGVVVPNSVLKTFFGLYSIGSGVVSRNDSVIAVAVPLPAACWTVVSAETSSDGSVVS
jgi:hypothetical protein